MLMTADFDRVTGAPLTFFSNGWLGQFQLVAAHQTSLGHIQGRVDESPEFIIIPKPSGYEGPVFTVNKIVKAGRIQMKFKEKSHG